MRETSTLYDVGDVEMRGDCPRKSQFDRIESITENCTINRFGLHIALKSIPLWKATGGNIMVFEMVECDVVCHT